MKNNIVINFDKVSKKFRRGERYYLKQALLDLFKKDVKRDFLALKDVSFKIKKGESVGIIGVNGSGKSTILKMIAGVLYPTKGIVEVSGRIGPLIELGAGFHPELSGRDNIYLNGVILGLSKEEIEQKFDEIVDFAELRDFIDTPVKHYSSGMYMRLGFSVAVAISPDILLVDEILAVGDIAFQKKCINKIKEFQKMGITCVIVSHNADLIKEMCQKVMLFDKGKLILSGYPKQVISRYFSKLKVA